MIMSDLKELREKRDFYYKELEELHIYEPSEQWYRTRRYEIESQICFIEAAIDDLEQQEKHRKQLLKVVFIGLGIALVTCLILLL